MGFLKKFFAHFQKSNGDKLTRFLLLGFASGFSVLLVLVLAHFVVASAPSFSHGVCANCHIGDPAVDHDDCASCHSGNYNPDVALREPPKNILADFSKASNHPLDSTDASTACKSCHNNKGDKNENGEDYPKLLRVQDENTGQYVFMGNAFCYACHGQGSTKIGGDMRHFESSSHSSGLFADPPSGTAVKCSTCHAPHGSSFPNLAKALGKDLCNECHTENDAPTPEDNELVTAILTDYSMGLTGSQYQIRVFSQDSYGTTTPKSIRGPKDYPFYRQPVATTVNTKRSRSLAIGDVNNDGKNEVIVSTTSKYLDVFNQDISKGLNSSSAYDTGTTGGYGVIIGNVSSTSSGNEIIVADSTGNAIKVFRLTGGFQLLQTVGTAGTAPKKLAIGDITNDGLADIVASNSGSGNISVFNQSGESLAYYNKYASGGGPYGVGIGDVDNNGLNEVAVANTTANTVTLFKQTADGGLPISLTKSVSLTGAYGLAVGDVLENQAGGEVVVTNKTANVYVYGSDQLLVRSTINAGTGQKAGEIAVGDVNGDNKKDIVVSSDPYLIVIPQNGTGTGFASPLTYYVDNNDGKYATTGEQPLAVGDIGNLYPYGHKVNSMSQPCDQCHNPHRVKAINPIEGASGVQPSNPGGRTRLEDSSSDIQYTGTSWATDTNASYSGGTAKKSTKLGEKATFTFTGSGVTLYSRKDTNAGFISVSIDGVYYPNIDLNGLFQYKVPVFSTNLPYGTHTMEMLNRLVVFGRNNTIWVDAFDVSPPAQEFAAVDPMDSEYELCLKCHSSNSSPMAGWLDKAVEFSTANSSYHPVEDIAKNLGVRDQAFTLGTSWNPTSADDEDYGSSSAKIGCIDCHSKSTTGSADINHGSANAYLLNDSANTEPSDSDMLCYKCHSYNVYYNGTAGSRFKGNSLGAYGHADHLKKGLTCFSCHLTHGVLGSAHLIREDLKYTHYEGTGTGKGGKCSGSGGCHSFEYYRNY
jgi:predicted CXXCH cytochrome family protein